MKVIKIKDIKDCNLNHVFECGQCFRWNQEGDLYVGVVQDKVAAASIAADVLTLQVSGGDETFWRKYFDLDTDYGEIKRSLLETACTEETDNPAECDIKLARAIESGYGIRILNQDLFETIISFIISQNNNIPRIKKLIESLCERYGECLGEFFGKKRYSFPTIEKLASVSPDELMEMKFGYRANYIPAAAEKFLSEGEPTSYEELLSCLGIGPKVANCIRLFGLHMTASFPIDTWVKHIMNDMYGFEESDTRGMEKFAKERFGRYAGYAQQYLFFYYRG